MALSVLITQCLQNDFVAPLRGAEPLPNKLHVGAAESERLLGTDPGTGPVAQLMRWAHVQDPARLAVVHIRDWHDPDDPAQSAHLEQFGAHALMDTPGARFVLDLDAVANESGDAASDPEATGLTPETHVVDAIGLNDFAETRLPVVLDALREHSDDGRLRVGVVGVWTEAKITFLLYDLVTRSDVAGIDGVSTCSALTASSSRLRHFAALEQIERILGVPVHDTVGSFTSWLVPQGRRTPAPPPTSPGFEPEIEVEGPALAKADTPIVGALFRDVASVRLSELGGGFSGNRVFRARARDAAGYDHAPCVVKLGDREVVGAERVAFERVEPLLGNRAPSIKGFIDLGERAGLKYAFASMGEGVQTFKSIYASALEAEDAEAAQLEIDAVLHGVFDEALAPLLDGARYDRIDLLDAYGFAPRWAPSVQRRVEKIAGAAARDAETLEFPDRPRPNVARFYGETLETLPRFSGRSHYVSWVHGDLNGANILRDDRGNVWVIDFARARITHALQDLAKLENDLLYIFTPLHDDDQLVQALRLTDALAAVRDLRAPLPETPPDGVDALALRRAWATLRTLRSYVARVCREDRDPWQMRVAGLRYAAHTLGFDESSPLQKRWALAAACDHATAIEAGLRRDLELRIDTLDAALLEGDGSLGLTIQPGRVDRGRDLAEDLATLARKEVDVVVSLLTRAEMAAVGVPDYLTRIEEAGFDVLHSPMPDQGVPTREEARRLIDRIETALGEARHVVLHCLGGLGRSGLIAACLLRNRGLSADDALAAVRQARGPRAVETHVQELFVRNWTP